MQRYANAAAGVALAEDLPPKACANAEILRTQALRKIFHSGGQEIAPVDGIDFSVQEGEMISIVGQSGAGKSTFLHLLAALDTPTSGDVYFAGDSLGSLKEAELADYRNHSVGFVWQRHHLLPDFSAAENVAMPLLVRGKPLGAALSIAKDWLGEVGLAHRAGQPAGQLSGGEQQRVAIARSLVNRPALLLADEPTGDLDERNAESVFELMQRLHESHHLTSIVATHNLSLARRTDLVFLLEHGKLAACKEVLAETTADAEQIAGAGAKTPGERVTRV
jgi:lipoprotein-releasing system ATP-binding protein